ncbi:MAG TPA: hypothetical protein VGH73_25905 [Thermoanaerobaculia bacterium]|jgi:hypothetical protein
MKIYRKLLQWKSRATLLSATPEALPIQERSIMSGRLIWFVLGLSCTGLFGFCSRSLAQEPISLACKSIEDPPAWVFSGEWDAKESGLILIDSLFSRVAHYSLQGERLRDLPDFSSGPMPIVKPSWIHRDGQGGYLLEDDGNRLVQLGSDYKPRKEFDLQKLKNLTGESIGFVWNWVMVGGDILAFSDVQDKSNWFSGFLRIPLANSSLRGFEVLGRRMEISDPARNFYLLGSPYIASLGDDSYFLVMGESPVVMRSVKGSSSLRSILDLSKFVGRRPELPEKRGAASVSSLFRKLEESSLPVGLYGWKGFLYVLARKYVVASDETEWRIIKIDPSRPRVIYSRLLLSKASHLIVIPGLKSWAFVEKGSVKGLGQQEVKSICSVPGNVW